MNDNDKLTLWCGALRYYMGRRSYAVGDFCSLLINEWDSLDKRTQDIIQRDLKREMVKDDDARAHKDPWRPLGDECDRKEWDKVVAFLESKNL